MAEFIGYMIQKNSDTEQDTKRLSKMLEEVGISVNLINRETVCLLAFSIDDKKFDRVVHRNAGRIPKNTHLHRTSEVFLYAQNHTAKQTAEFCQISLRTYQRRLKREKEQGTWNLTNNCYFGEYQ